MVDTNLWWNDLTRDRTEAVLQLVLDAIGDDYQDVEMVLKTINEGYPKEPGLEGWKAMDALPVSRPEVAKALRELVQEGFAQSCVYEVATRSFRAVNPPRGRMTGLWFYATEKGLRAINQFHQTDSEMC